MSTRSNPRRPGQVWTEAQARAALDKALTESLGANWGTLTGEVRHLPSGAWKFGVDYPTVGRWYWSIWQDAKRPHGIALKGDHTLGGKAVKPARSNPVYGAAAALPASTTFGAIPTRSKFYLGGSARVEGHPPSGPWVKTSEWVARGPDGPYNFTATHVVYPSLREARKAYDEAWARYHPKTNPLAGSRGIGGIHERYTHSAGEGYDIYGGAGAGQHLAHARTKAAVDLAASDVRHGVVKHQGREVATVGNGHVRWLANARNNPAAKAAMWDNRSAEGWYTVWPSTKGYIGGPYKTKAEAAHAAKSNMEQERLFGQAVMPREVYHHLHT